MIIPSIDIMDGRAVQLRQGKELVLEGGDPFERLRQFSVVGEVAVVDLDAARGTRSNRELIHEMVRTVPCRVGGGIRDLATATQWLDAGACKIMIGTAATVEFCSALPRDRVIAAVDAERGAVVVKGWQERTELEPIARIAELAPHVGGFLLTQVEHEGGMSGFDFSLVERAVAAAGDARVVAAGGITTGDDICRLDRLGSDAQVGMALYSDTLSLGDAVAAVLDRAIDDRLWPTVVVDEHGQALGLVWSTRESLAAAVEQQRGIYWSRSREEIWIKGATSGATQELLRVDLDCDRDALRFTVRQAGAGFCHTGTRSCWPDRFELGALERTIAQRQESSDAASGTRRLFGDPSLLAAKLVEEAQELAVSSEKREVAHETADLLYFALVKARSSGVSLSDVVAELELRSRKVNRRLMAAKTEGTSS